MYICGGKETDHDSLFLGLWLAQYTTKLKFGCGFNVLPRWHPLRLAEDFAMADILTGGRVIFGIGRGYHTREVETFGAPMEDADANRELFEEQFEIIMKAFHEASFSHQGKHYTLPPAVPYRGYQLRRSPWCRVLSTSQWRRGNQSSVAANEVSISWRGTA